MVCRAFTHTAGDAYFGTLNRERRQEKDNECRGLSHMESSVNIWIEKGDMNMDQGGATLEARGWEGACLRVYCSRIRPV